jgi:hypothetical protein
MAADVRLTAPLKGDPAWGTKMRRLLAAFVLLHGVVLPPLSAQVQPSGLVVIVDAEQTAGDATLGLRFQITLRNTGALPLLLNGGALLGNGRQGWLAVTCGVQSAAGTTVPLELHWQMGGVAGRVYFLGVPLRPGDSHTLTVTPADYFIGTPLQPGRYGLRCTFTGKASEFRDATQLPAVWEGIATSKVVPVEITAGSRSAAGE